MRGAVSARPGYLTRMAVLAGLLLAALAAPAAENPSSSLTPVTLQLRWLHQFQFAGYYAAKEQGYYRDIGLDVKIVQASPGREPVREVLEGRADYGVANDEVLHQRLLGEPLVALAAIFQHSGSILVVRRDSSIRSPQDLIGKRVMLISKGADVGLIAMLGNEGVDIDKVTLIQSSYDVNDLVEGRVDAFNAYLTNEPFYLEHKKVPYTIIYPGTYGIDFYSDILFTTEQELAQHPERVRQFRAASLRGWSYAMDHPEEVIELILRDYNQTKSRENLRYEAEKMRELIMPDLIQYGHMNPGRWRHMADTFVREGMVDADYSLEGFIYDAIPKPDFSRWQNTALALSGALIALLLVAALLIRYNRRLRAAIDFGEQVQTALGEKTALFQAIFDSMPDATVVTNTQREIIMSNPALSRTFGYTSEELRGHSSAILYASLDDYEHQGRLRYHANAASRPPPYEITFKRKNGEEFPSLTQGASVVDARGRLLGFVAVMRDITAQKRNQEEIERLALTDPVTGLANRHYFNQRFSEAIKLAERQDLWLSLAMMDLDLFKEVNDCYGHPVGDEVLVRVGQVLKTCFRETDVIARIGGDEFAIIIMGPESLDAGRQLAERVIDAFSQPLELDGCDVTIGASFGIATYPLDSIEGAELIRLADSALYSSKHRGRNTCTLASDPVESEEAQGGG